MNNIYVDELPKNCIDCPCESESYCNVLNVSIDIREHIATPQCPLKLLSTRLAEERKKVVTEIKSHAYGYCIDPEILNQIERGESK